METKKAHARFVNRGTICSAETKELWRLSVIGPKPNSDGRHIKFNLDIWLSEKLSDFDCSVRAASGE